MATGTDQTHETTDLVESIRDAGIAGAGGAGFPAYAKWEHLDEVDTLLVNHQESEPNFLKDRWLGQQSGKQLAALFDRLLETSLDLVVIGTKHHYRGLWLGALEEHTEATVYGPDDLPIDTEAESGVVLAGTEDRYEFGMESVLLRLVTDTVIGSDLPVDHGFIVQNTETLFNIHRALTHGEPVTHKYVHVDGDTPRHRFLKVPIGTTGADLLAASGRPGGPGDHEVLADGGPGWSFEIERSPEMFGTRKRTNCLLIIDDQLAEENKLGGGRINILGPQAWKGREFESEPTALNPDRVRIPLLTNTDFEGLVEPSVPTVAPGEFVSVGDRIARPADEGISNPQHASIDGEVTAVTEHHITIEQE